MSRGEDRRWSSLMASFVSGDYIAQEAEMRTKKSALRLESCFFLDKESAINQRKFLVFPCLAPSESRYDLVQHRVNL